MKFIEELLKDELTTACNNAGYNCDNISVQICNLEGFGDYQCNDAMAMAKQYKKAPFIIAEEIISKIENSKIIEKCEVAKPGYINIFIKNNFLTNYVNEYVNNIEKEIKNKINPQKIVIDYGGANVAKPLHVGHLRSANIGESIKRICKYVGNDVLGDVHLGDWGLQMGMVISELKRRNPNLVYFDDTYTGEYPTQSPVTIKDLETLYPEASKKAKADEELMNQAKQATLEFQKGKPGYVALCKHIVETSKKDLKNNYDTLNVDFDLWLGESDAKVYCDKVIEFIKNKGMAYESEGALVVDVKKEDDKKEVPPFMLINSAGAVLYSTTDLATIVQREQDYDVDKIIYVVDNRQEMHFTQLFRVVEKTKITNKDISLEFVGFGTMNGSDGKPYKTRDGGVMQLSVLIDDVVKKAKEKTDSNLNAKYNQNEVEHIAKTVAISALKFADLAIFRSKDYIFDIDKFCSFDGKTGPYLLYTITRAKSILDKINKKTTNGYLDIDVCDKKIILALIQFHNEVISAYKQLAPSVLCDYVYKLANLFNSFYSKCNIIKEQDQNKQNSWINLTSYTLQIMEKVLNLLGINTLDRM